MTSGGREGFVPQSYCASLQRSVDDSDFVPSSDAWSYVSCPYSCSCSEPSSELLSDPDNDHLAITEDAIDDLFKQKAATAQAPKRRRPIMHRTKSLLDATIGCLGCVTDDSDTNESASDLEPLLRDIINAKLTVDSRRRVPAAPNPEPCICGAWSFHKSTMQHNCEQLLIEELFASDKNVVSLSRRESSARQRLRIDGRTYMPPYLETLQEEDSDCYTLPRLYPIQRRRASSKTTPAYGAHSSRQACYDDRFIVLFRFGAGQDGELLVERGQFVTLLSDEDPDWWRVKRADDSEGVVPSNCLFPASQWHAGNVNTAD